MRKDELVRQSKQLEVAGMLQQTFDRSGQLSGAVSINYFELPRSRSSHGRAVVSFANLLSSGHLNPEVAPVYGVIAGPLAEDDRRADNEQAVRSTQEFHVLAEHFALRNGIFTPYGRTTAEVAVIDKLMPAAPRAEFAALRIAHLGALLETVEADSTMTRHSQDRVGFELQRAQQHLQTNY